MKTLHPRWRVRRTPALLAVLMVLFLTAPGGSAQDGDSEAWVGTWATAPVVLLPPDQRPTSPRGPEPIHINDQTLRQIVHTSVGGSGIRVALTNLFGSEPLEVGAAHVALRAGDGPHIVADDDGALRFGGRSAVTISAGKTVLSDPIELDVPALVDVAIDLYLPGDPSNDRATYHAAALTTSYVSSAGNHTGATEFPVETSLQNWFYLSAVHVLAPVDTPVVVTLGDSITDGTASTPDTNSRWPDFLARRLNGDGHAGTGVLNAGIAGNRVLADNMGLGRLLGGDPNAPPPDPNALFGPSALSRLDRDVLAQPGVTHVIVLESTNDIGMAFDAETPTVEELIAGHTELVERAHDRGLTIWGGTLVPFEGAFYFRDVGETKRQAFNEWIRTSGVYDAVIDFDAAVRDAGQPNRFVESYQSGDWLHPSDEGYRMMAEAIDLVLLSR